MILNFYITTSYFIVFSYFINLLILHESVTTSYSDVGDILSSLFMNDFFINSYYLLWTSFWYLPTFLLLSFSILLINYSNRGTGYFWFFIGLVLLLVSLHYQNLNLYNYSSSNCGSNFNVLLSNSVNNFHPALFYLTLSHLLISLQLFLLNINSRYNLNLNLTINTYLNNILFPVIIFTLFLGSWWALQEGSWGGWWNWDPSEVFGLLVMLYYLYILHNSQNINNYPLFTYSLGLLSSFVAITYVFIQLNFDLVSHNFGTNVDQFVDTSQNFLVFIVFFTVVILSVMRHFIAHLIILTVTFSRHNTFSNKLTPIWHITLTLVISFILLSSFSLLINDFLWNLLTINVFNNTNFTYFYTSLVITALLPRLWNAQVFSALLFLYSIYFSNEILLLGLIPVITNINTLHIGVTSLLFLLLSESNQTTSFWEILYENISYTQERIVNDVFPMFISLNNFMLEYSVGILTNSNPSESVWNFIWTSSSNEGHGFLHSLTSDVLTQSLHSGNGLSSYTINVLDFCISPNNFLVVSILIFIHHVINTSNLIIS